MNRDIAADMDALPAKLRQALDADAVTSAGPPITVAPASEDQLADALRLVREAGAPVRVQGNDSKADWGLPLNGSHAVTVETRRLQHGLRHDREDLVASVPAGLPWRRFQQELAAAGQWVPLDPPLAAKASVGGVVAAATSGPRRLTYGAVRDLVIGARAVLVDGRSVIAGGRVIKNVAGYDLCKLLTGSFGGLAVITEVTWKVAPLPQHMAVLTVDGADFDRLLALALEVLHTPLLPAAVQLLWPGTSGTPCLRLDLEGLEPVVQRQIRDLRPVLAQADSQPLLTGPDLVTRPDDLLGAIDAVPYPDTTDAAVIRLGVPAGRLAAAFASAQHHLGHMGGSPLRADVNSGLAWWQLPASASPSAALEISALDQALAGLKGYAVVESGPAPLRQAVHREQAHRFALTHRVKQVFDPTGILNPGRLGQG